MKALFAFLLGVGATWYLVQDQKPQEKQHILVAPDDLKWEEGPDSLPAGAKVARVEGDPKKEGPYTMRLKLPANYRIPPHWHPQDEHVTVIYGKFYIGMGDRFDESTAKEIPAGGFGMLPMRHAHYAFTREETVIQLHGQGPWGIEYIEPQDDPRRKK